MAHSRSPSITSSPDKTTTTTTIISGCKTTRPQMESPSSVAKAWGKVEMMFSYVWLVVQILLLVAGLTVLNFATLMVILSYCIFGYFIKPRREFQSYVLD